MKKLLHNLFSFATAIMLFVMVAAPANAQEGDTFRPYKGTCWGLFYDYEDLDNPLALLPVEYVHAKEGVYVIKNFLGCGKNLTIAYGAANAEGYADVELFMEGALYDNSSSAYFYAPFTSGSFEWTIRASNGELVGPISQKSSYYYPELEYIGLSYVSYPDQKFHSFDIKTQQDYYEGQEREYIEQDEADILLGLNAVVAPSVQTPAYDLFGRHAMDKRGVVIQNGRKVLR